MLQQAMTRADTAWLAASNVVEQGGQQGDAGVYSKGALCHARYRRNSRLMHMLFTDGVAASDATPSPEVAQSLAAQLQELQDVCVWLPFQSAFFPEHPLVTSHSSPPPFRRCRATPRGLWNAIGRSWPCGSPACRTFPPR